MACTQSAAFLAISVFFFIGTASAFAGGDGSVGDPYRIANCTQLQNMTANLTASYVLNGNIDCSATSGWNPLGGGFLGFIPVGTGITPFTGTFDGQGNSISDLFINRSSADYVGLFGSTVGADISNVGIVDANMTSNGRQIGALAGRAVDVDIDNCSSSGTINDIGGTFYISRLEGAEWVESYKHRFNPEYATERFSFDGVDGELTLTIVQRDTEFSDVDMAMLQACGENLTPSYAMYTDTGVSVLEDVLRIDNNVTIAHERPIEVSWDVPQGCRSAELYLTANEYSSGSPLTFPQAGLATYVMGSNPGTVTVDGLIGERDGSEPLYAAYWAPSTGHPPGYTYIYVSDDSENLYLSLDVTCDNTNEFGEDWTAITIAGRKFVIRDSNATFGRCAFGMTSKVNYNHQTCEFSIPKGEIGPEVMFFLEYYGTAAITPAAGGLVGYAHDSTINNSHSTASVTGTDYVGGLVGYSYTSTIDNSNATGSVTGTDWVGGLVGRNKDNSVINDSYATGDVNGSADVGGLLGQNDYFSAVDNSYATGNVTGVNQTGGLVGDNDESSSVDNSYATGDVTGENENIGGLVGRNQENSTISNSYATGAVDGVLNLVGGLVGYNDNSTIEDSYAAGAVTGNFYVGGLVGVNDLSSINNSYANGTVKGTEDNVGGLVGVNSDSTIDDSYATGDVNGSDDYVGGLVGANQDSTIENSYATGAVTGHWYVGGLVGQNIDGSAISNSYATGNVTLTIGTPHGATFHISRGDSGTWQEAYAHRFPSEYSTMGFAFSGIDGELALRVVQTNIEFAGVDAIVLEACGETLAPSYATYVNTGQSVLNDILKVDNNVTVAHEMPIEVSWAVPQGCSEAVMYLTANEYGSGPPFSFPASGLASYKMGSNSGAITADGVIETDGSEPLYMPYWVPASGHPAGYTYIYVSDDGENLYFSLDVTCDNTNEAGVDWTEIAIGDDAFRIDDFSHAWGDCAFGMTSKVNYNHQTCEFSIPKGEIGPEVKFLLRYYGSATPGNYSGGLVGDNSGSTITNCYWLNRTDDAEDCYYGGNDNCTAETVESYFFDNTNAPMDVWDFCETPIWGIDGGYPMLAWEDDFVEAASCTPEEAPHHHHHDECDRDSDCSNGKLCCRGDCEECCTDSDCDDSNPCTDDNCDSNKCEYADNTLTCDDGDSCTRNDRCSAGSCKGVDTCECRSSSDCDDNDACTSDSCVNNKCVSSGSCPQPCTTSWSCTPWGECANSLQSRDCTCSCADDACSGDSSTTKPCRELGGSQSNQTQTAAGENESGLGPEQGAGKSPKAAGDSGIWMYLAAGIAIGLFLFWLTRRRGKKK